MHDAGGVRRGQRVRNLTDDAQRPRFVERPIGLDQRRQALSLDELQRQVKRSVFQAAKVGRGRDVGVLDARRGHGLALEARHHLGHRRHLAVQHLDGDRLAHVHVLRAVHRAHAARAEQRYDAIAPSQHFADEIPPPRRAGCPVALTLPPFCETTARASRA
ncbi:MAG: hypothetical protein QM756_46625 [Polyangiaceae bacterium]